MSWFHAPTKPPMRVPVPAPSSLCADKTSGYLYTSIHPWGWPTVTITMCPTGARVAVTSQLDTAGGQSGSPVYSTDGRVRAVHSAVGGGKSYHAPIDYTAYTFIKKYRK